MKKALISILIICLSLNIFSYSTTAINVIDISDDAELNIDKESFIPNEVILITKELVDLSYYEGSGRFDFYGINITKIKPLFNEIAKDDTASIGNCFAYKITLDGSISVESAVTILNNNDNIRCAEPNYILSNSSSNNDFENGTDIASPRATGAVYQWAHTYLQMSQVWGMGFVGSQNVKVAILDVGFVQTYDLQNNLNMSLAYDSVDVDYDVSTTDNHGNRVAGIIGADYNDGGVNGICRNVTMIPIKVIPTQNPNDYTVELLSLGVYDAISMGADIINVCLIMDDDSSVIRTLVETNKVLFVTSAGNQNKDIAEASHAVGKRHDDAYWIVVGAATQNETKYETSNFSSRYCDIFAPGENIATSGLSDGYATGYQTSMATPHVTAACALIMSHATHKTPLQVKDLILAYAKPVDAFETLCTSGGSLSIINVVNALYNESRGAYSKGDVNGNGKVTSADVSIIRQIYNEEITPTSSQRTAADINKNGSVDSTDILLAQRFVNKTYYFPPR